MDKVLIVGLGGFIGANVRYWLGAWIDTQFGLRFPLGTLSINLTASLLLGFIQPGGGTVMINNMPLGEDIKQGWREMGSWIPQKPRLTAPSPGTGNPTSYVQPCAEVFPAPQG